MRGLRYFALSNLFSAQSLSRKNNIEGIFNCMHIVARYGSRNDYNQLLLTRTTITGTSVFPSRQVAPSYITFHRLDEGS